MRAEVKVGLIVGLVAIAGGTVWWFSRGTDELDELPLDRRAMEAKSKDEAKLASDTVPVRPDSRSADSSSLTPRGRRSPAPTRQAPPTPPPRRRSEPSPEKLATTRPSPKPAERTTPSTPSGTEKPVAQDSGQEAAATDAGKPAVDRSSPKPARPPRPETKWPRRKTYVIQPGDRLIDIARAEYDDWRLWEAIKAANPGLDETRLQIGQQIEVPSRAEAMRLVQQSAPAQDDSAARPPTEPDADSVQAGRATYVVARGDSLIKIARNVLHDETRWEEIFELNRDRLESPHLLRVGMELRLPALEKKASPKKAEKD